MVVNLVMMSPSSSPAPCRRRVNPNLSSRLLHRRRKGRCDAAAAAAAVILGHSGAHFGSCGNAGSGTTQRNPLKIATKGRLAVTSATPSPVCVVDDERYAQITALPEAAALNLPLDEEWHLTVPATSANMGPGFDTLGIALEVLNEVCVRWRTDVDTFEGIDPFTSDPQVTLLGEGVDSLPCDATNGVVAMVKRGYESTVATDKMKLPIGWMEFVCVNRIPPARGMGSSSGALVAGIAAGMALRGHDVTTSKARNILLQETAALEGHPDNVAPCIYGGFQLCYTPRSLESTMEIDTDNGELGDALTRSEKPAQYISRRVEPPTTPPLAVLYIPDFESSTKETRASLPTEYSVKDVVFTISRNALLIHAYSCGEWKVLDEATRDRMHQPYRGDPSGFPLSRLLKAAQEAGAHGSFMSGAGPTVLAFAGGYAMESKASNVTEPATPEAMLQASAVADAMDKAAKAAGLTGRSVVTAPSNNGVVAQMRRTVDVDKMSDRIPDLRD